MQALHYDFEMKGSVVLVPGWRAVKGSFSDEDTESLQRLPDMKNGDELKIKNVILEKRTLNLPCHIPKPHFCQQWKMQEKKLRMRMSEELYNVLGSVHRLQEHLS